MKGFTRTAALAVLLTVASAATAQADTFRPTRFDDPVPGKCKPNNCSLREAVIKANKHQGKDRIVLGAGTYVIELAETIGDDNQGGDFDVIGEAVITGKGPLKTVVDGNEVSGVFALLTFPPHTVKNMTIEDGNRNIGGGISTGPSKITIKNVVLKSNTATQGGGGLYTVSQDLTISRTTLSENDASGGGGMYVPAGVVGPPTGVIRASTFSGNDAELGAGLYLDGFNDGFAEEDPDLEVVNSTFAENQATVSGGGIAAILGSTILVDNSTIAYNGADVDNSGGGSGGGMFQSSSADFQITDIILAANTVGGSGTGPSCAGSFLGGGLIAGGAAACTIGGTFVADAMIGSLAGNGGPTETIALLAGSPAIDRPNPFDCPERDQRGRKRDPDCDTGSFERKPSDP